MMYDFLYLDSDGVVCNFSSRVAEIHDGVGKIWGAIEHYNRTVAPFFESLDKMPDADKLVQFALANFEHVAILTATGFTPKDVAQQKRNWYAKHYPTLKVICVDRSADKARYATPTTILVDDRLHSITPWTNAGGIGVLHTSVDDTIEQLQELLGKIK